VFSGASLLARSLFFKKKKKKKTPQAYIKLYKRSKVENKMQFFKNHSRDLNSLLKDITKIKKEIT
jgi:hypothetical protein